VNHWHPANWVGLFLFLFWWDWGLNSGLCKAGLYCLSHTSSQNHNHFNVTFYILQIAFQRISSN
jgi:hypothetical protein